jgi:hypothetical protein
VGEKLPLDLHGAAIEWFFQVGEGTSVSPSPVPDIPFNMFLTGRELGVFNVCATVMDHTGCLTGTVIPQPTPAPPTLPPTPTPTPTP